jgi:glyoxylate reductase
VARYVVTGELPEAARSLYPTGIHFQFTGPGPAARDVLLTEVAKAEGLLCTLVDRIDVELLAAAAQLRVISQLAVGVDNIDVSACTSRRIPVGHTPDVLTETTADTAMALLLASLRRIPEGQEFVRTGQWKQWSFDLLTGEDLHGSTVGIVGLGRIGAAIVRRLNGFGVRMLYSGPRRKAPFESRYRIGYRTLEDLLTESDHVILSAPLNDSTRRMIDEAALEMMKPGATLVNISRGGLVDHDALAGALSSGRLGRAALDVTDPEPIPVDHPLVTMSNCIVIPHLGSASVQTRLAMARRALENLVAGLEGRRLRWCVNPEVYEA